MARLVFGFFSICILAGATAQASPAFAAQALIPTPYPTGVTGALPLDPEPQGRGGPQRLNRDPYPQILGENAQGNPPISRRMRRQHLIPTINQRKYRVDRIPTYPQ